MEIITELKNEIYKDIEQLTVEQIKHIHKLILYFKQMTKEGR